ncbi:MAG: aminotransferase class V-fold PLP-dependent enzyme [Bacillota bacterium]|nr:aminotransferase class V-fold PLP-dependent enzyme [Bacillota bacterium]
MAYFDQAATTYPKPECVYSAMDKFNRTCGGSAGRGAHNRAQSAAAIIADTRKRLQSVLQCPSKQVVFQPTATIALNVIIQGVIKSGAVNVYITPFEHNAVTRVLHPYLNDGKIKLHQLTVTDSYEYDITSIQSQFAVNTPDFVIVSHVSNTIGLIAPAEEIFYYAKKYGAITLLDMAQSAGLISCNVGLETIDYAVFAGHKTLFGPTGISGFVMKPALKLEPILFGGTGYESANQTMPVSIPERFEIGTINAGAIAGLNAALQWIEETGINNIRAVEEDKRQKLLSILTSYDFIHVVGISSSAQYAGIVSCLIDGISSDSAGSLFSELGIAVRTGLHCAPYAHQFLHTYPAGTIRFSVNYFTSDDDFRELDEALQEIEANL